jgi:Uma2 family endonuclease
MHMTRERMVTSRRLSYGDYLRFPDDGNRHELIDGVHYVTPAPSVRHQRIVARLHGCLWQYLEDHGGGEVLFAPLAVVFSMFDVVEPDLLYVSDARKRILTDQHVQGAPDLVVEVLSPSTRRRDEGIKRALYERADVTEYWVVDPAAEVVRIHRRRGTRLSLTAEIPNEPDQRVRSPLFPALSLATARLFGR